MMCVTNIMAMFSGFARDEDAAVTVDWVVLTATVLFLGVASMFLVAGNIPGFADRISSSISNMPVGAQ